MPQDIRRASIGGLEWGKRRVAVHERNGKRKKSRRKTKGKAREYVLWCNIASSGIGSREFSIYYWSLLRREANGILIHSQITRYRSRDNLRTRTRRYCLDSDRHSVHRGREREGGRGREEGHPRFYASERLGLRRVLEPVQLGFNRRSRVVLFAWHDPPPPPRVCEFLRGRFLGGRFLLGSKFGLWGRDLIWVSVDSKAVGSGSCCRTTCRMASRRPGWSGPGFRTRRTASSTRSASRRRATGAVSRVSTMKSSRIMPTEKNRWVFLLIAFWEDFRLEADFGVGGSRCESEL